MRVEKPGVGDSEGVRSETDLATELAAVWDEPPAHQYGRPIRFLQQLRATNVDEAWEKLDRPTL